MNEFKLPDVGEGLTEAEILSWHVSVGDVVEVNDILVDIETAKSVVELPSPVAGIIEALHVGEGVTVDVGTVLVSIRDEVGSESASAEDSPDEKELAVGEEKPLVLVGTGPSVPAARRRRLGARQGSVPDPAPTSPADRLAATTVVRAKPPVRLLAKQLGVDLEEVASRIAGPVTRSDVERAVWSVKAETSTAPVRETRVPIKGVRKVIASAMTTSAFTAPHVTEWVTIDVTSTMELVARLKQDRQWADVRITPLVLVAKAFLLAVRRHPEINARWDESNQEIVLQHYVNLGIAAATPRGLVVPNIKDAHTLDLRGLATALDVLVLTARSGKTQPEDMAKGTVTITNIGAFGIDTGTPILNPGESAILAFGAVREMPWVVDGRIEVRKVTQLAMSFDHRLVDGELGSKVLADTGRILSAPSEAMLFV